MISPGNGMGGRLREAEARRRIERIVGEQGASREGGGRSPAGSGRMERRMEAPGMPLDAEQRRGRKMNEAAELPQGYESGADKLPEAQPHECREASPKSALHGWIRELPEELHLRRWIDELPEELSLPRPETAQEITGEENVQDAGEQDAGEQNASRPDPEASAGDGVCAKETDEPEKERMQPPVKVIFTCREKYDREEYLRQIKNQEKGMKELSLYEYTENRKKYQETGRDTDVGDAAQKEARAEARADRIAENRRAGMSRAEAAAEADRWLETQAALHDPDQIAGGDAANVTGMGDKEINASIGSQWRGRIGDIDEAVKKYLEENALTEEDEKKIYLNVELEVVSE